MINCSWLPLILVAVVLPASGCSAQSHVASDNILSQKPVYSNSTTKTEPVVRDCADCPEMVKVNGVGDRGQAIFVGRFELMWREYYQSMAAAGCPPPANLDGTVLRDDPGSDDRYPITSIKPMDINCYLSWLSKKTGKTYRLPTEREWMRLAALSGVKEQDTVRTYPRARAFLRDASSPFLGLGADELNAMSIASDEPREAVRHGSIAPVGLKEPDRLGLYDLIGNLPEMIVDLPPGVSPVVLGRQTVAAKGAGLGTPDINLNLLAGYQGFFASHTGWSVGYRVLREE